MPDPTPIPVEPDEDAIESVARAMQDWCENGTIHLSTHVPKSWDEDDPEWWIGLAEVALSHSAPEGDAAAVQEARAARENELVACEDRQRAEARAERYREALERIAHGNILHHADYLRDIAKAAISEEDAAETVLREDYDAVALRLHTAKADLARLTAKLAAAEAERDALARMVWRLTKGRQPKMNESFPFNPDYTFVTKSDLAMVLTVYEAHTDEDARQASPWYLACKAALDWPTLAAAERHTQEVIADCDDGAVETPRRTPRPDHP